MPMSNLKIMGLVVGFIVLGGLVAAGMVIAYNKVARLVNPYNDREISGPIVLSQDWIEIKPRGSLIADRPVQEIVLELDKTIRVNLDTFKLELPDRSFANPEVQLMDQKGNIYTLPVPSAAKSTQGGSWLRGFGMGIEASRKLPADTVFTTVRLRSDKPVPCSRVFWRTYDPKDLK